MALWPFCVLRVLLTVRSWGHPYFAYVPQYLIHASPARPRASHCLQPFLLLPSYYFTTGVVQGRDLATIKKRFKEEWLTASTGSLGFWMPACYLNFLLVPQPFQIVVVSVMSFIHKTWLSWLSNRPSPPKTLPKRTAAPIAENKWRVSVSTVHSPRWHIRRANQLCSFLPRGP